MKYRRMNKFSIREISAVDHPAQGAARMTIMKRATLEKKSALTDPMDGHSHVLHGIDDSTAGVTSHASGREGEGHSHDWIMGPNGDIIVGATNGHTHRIGFFSKHAVADVLDETHFTQEQLSASSEKSGNADQTPPQDTTMNESEFQAKIDELTKSLADVTADRDVILKHAKMTDVEKSHYASLEGEDAKTAFLVSGDKPAQIAKALEVAKALDPVVAVTEDGVEILKSQDPTGLLTAAIEKAKHDKKKKKEDDDDKKKKSFLENRAELFKRAAELTNIPGDENVRAEMLKAFDSIEDEDMRNAAHAALVAKNTSLADAFMEKGAVGSPKDQSADEQLDTMAKALEIEDKTTYEVAYTKALLSDEGQKIYNKRLEG